VDPRLAGINFILPNEKAGPTPGWYGIDVNHLRGSDLQAADGKGNWRCFDDGQFCYFLNFEPTAMAGYSIYIYHIKLDQANRVRRELGLPELKEEASGEPDDNTAKADTR
jgi:hypothetical protein